VYRLHKLVVLFHKATMLTVLLVYSYRVYRHLLCVVDQAEFIYYYLINFR